MGWRTPGDRLAPERFTTARMVVRLWQPDDAPAMVEAITADLGHLREWMDWDRDEPKPVQVKRAFIDECRQNYLRGALAAYGLFDPDEREIWGSIGYHHRIGDGAREIGYWIRSNKTNQGLMTEAAGALTWLGMKCMNLGRLEIHCDPMNAASARVPAKLGYHLHTIMHKQVKDLKLSPRSTMVWALNRSGFPATSAASFAPVTIGNQPADAFIEGVRQL